MAFREGELPAGEWVEKYCRFPFADNPGPVGKPFADPPFGERGVIVLSKRHFGYIDHSAEVEHGLRDRPETVRFHPRTPFGIIPESRSACPGFPTAGHRRIRPHDRAL